MMNVIKTDIEGVIIIEPKVFKDNRGYFYETYNDEEFQNAIGHPISFIQDNESKSMYGVLRGIHFQDGLMSQAKLVRVTRGKVLDVAVDLRKNSPTYGKWTSVILSARNRRQFFLPKGFGHGFVVLSKTAIFQYKCDEFYCKESELGIAWDDLTLNIDWGIPKDDIILSEKDKHHESFEEFDKHNLF